MELSPQVANLIIGFVVPFILTLLSVAPKLRKGRASEGGIIAKSATKLLSALSNGAKEDKQDESTELIALVKSAQAQMVSAVEMTTKVAELRYLQFEQEMKARQDEIKVLKLEIAALQQFRDKDRLQVETLQRKVSELEDRLLKAKKELDLTIVERDNATTRADAADERANAAERKYNELKEQFRQLQSELDELRQTVNILQSVTVPRAEVQAIAKEMEVVKKQTTGNLPPLNTVLLESKDGDAA